MANKFARANGNFNDAIWASTPAGVAGSISFPVIGDDVWANSFVVTITGNAACTSLNNGVSATSNGTSTTGGYFLVDASTTNASLTTTVGLNADLTTNIVILSGTQNIFLSGAIYGGANSSAVAVRSYCTNNTVTILGSIFMTAGISTGTNIGLSIEPTSNATYNITGNISKLPGSRGGTTGSCVLRCDGIGSTVNLNGNINMNGGSSSYVETVVNQTAGTFNHVGSFTGPVGGNHSEIAMLRVQGGTYNLTTPSLYASWAGAFGNNFPIILNAGGTVNINAGSIIGGVVGGGSWRLNALTTSSGITNITAGLISAGSGIHAVSQTGGTVKVIAGNILTNTTTMNAINSTGGTLTVSSNILNYQDGTQAIYAPSYLINPVPINGYIRYARSGTGVGTDAWLYQYTVDSLSAFSMPPVSSVRAGLVYASNSMVGTCNIPSASAVTFGTLVDNTIGRAVVTAEDILQIFSTPLSSLNEPNTIGIKLKNAATIESTGHLIASFTNG